METAQSLAALYAREIRALRREVEAYPDDASLWKKPQGISNTGGALAHHLIGNLRHFLGARLGGTSYVRDRPAEFARTDLSKADLLGQIDTAEKEVAQMFSGMKKGTLESDFPDVVAGHHVGNQEVLLHLLSHLGYHLGQIDYHRRIVTGDGKTVDAIAVAEIPGLRKA